MGLRDVATGKIELPQRRGHDHFWQRAMSRRQMIGSAAAAAGAVAGAALVRPKFAFASPENADPKPIPGGLVVGDQGFHVNAPGPTGDQSSIYDFTGVVGVATVQGSGMGRQGGAVVPLAFDTDMRFMQGTYISVDGQTRNGTFGFI